MPECRLYANHNGIRAAPMTTGWSLHTMLRRLIRCAGISSLGRRRAAGDAGIDGDIF